MDNNNFSLSLHSKQTWIQRKLQYNKNGNYFPLEYKFQGPYAFLCERLTEMKKFYSICGDA